MPRTLTENFVEQFRLCKVHAERDRRRHRRTRREGGVRRGCGRSRPPARRRRAGAARIQPVQPKLPPYAADGREVPALLAAAGECDFVVDVTVGGLIHSDVRTRITGNGKRMLFVAEPNDVLERLMGGAELRSVVEGGGTKLKAGSTLRVTSAAGTDLTADISGEDLPITHQWGYVDEPGRWDHWPSGFVACFPRDRSRRGPDRPPAGRRAHPVAALRARDR